MIKCLDETVPEIYIGSTSDYKQRQRGHKSDCNNPNNKKYNVKLYRFIRSKGGFDNFKFEIIEECSNEDKLELEKMYIEMYDPELNTNIYKYDKKEWDREYNKKNKEKIKEYNKEKICCRACRCEIRRLEFKRHCDTNKHINNLKNII
jgi:hypothetical protein